MIANYFKIGFRILIRQRSYTVLNILGLSIGIAVFVFIYLYVQSEIRYDRYWSDSKNIYRVWNEYSLEGKVEKVAISPFRLAGTLKKNFPGVLEATKLFFTDPSDVNDMSSLTYNGKVYEVPNITLSDSGLFRIFNYNFLEGDPRTALSKPNSMVISSKVARQIFGNEKAIGKKLKTVRREYTVTGVFDKNTCPSHLDFDAVVSEYSLSPKSLKQMNSDWFWLGVYTYVKLADTVNPESFEKRANDFITKQISAFIDSANINIDGYTVYHLEPVRSIHFNTTLAYDSPSNTNSGYLIIFSIIAGFILLTASINYINLAMARSLKRAKEVGMRKVLGAFRKQLAMQYISEAFIVVLIAFVLALSLVELLMPWFNALVGKNLTLVGTLFSRQGIGFGLLLIFMMIILAVVSGIFPAFILSRYNPVNVLKGNNFFINVNGKQKISAGGIRKVLVVIQYVVSIGMIIATMIIFAQMRFLKDHDPGFDEKNVIVINTPDDTAYYRHADEFKKELKAIPGVIGVSTANNAPGYTYGKSLFHVGDTSDKALQTMSLYIVDTGFFNVLKIPLVEGKFFDGEMKTDSAHDYIINQAAAKDLGLDQPVGSALEATFFEKSSGRIVGVVKDFNFSSLHTGIEPLAFLFYPKESRYILVRLDEKHKNAVIVKINNVWDKYNKGHFMHYTFLEDKIQSLYGADRKMLSIFIYFTFFVMFISSLGLYGLSSFLIEQRTKEIGIRKVLGGSDLRIILLLAKDYTGLVFISGLVASPIVYFLMKKWLDTFSIHISINGWSFVAGILLMMALAFLTVVIRSFHVLRQNPALALKYE